MFPKVLVALLLVTIFCSLVPAALAESKDIALEEPLTGMKVDLIQALKLRKSTREFADQKVSWQEMATILWAANGVNRENGKRTAPSAYGKYFIDIYIVSSQGAYRYEPEKNRLKFIHSQDLTHKIPAQGFAKSASHILVLVGNLNEFPFFVKKEERLSCAHATAGCIGENVYLTAGAMNLGACIMAGFNEKETRAGLKLKKEAVPLYIMPVGYPK